MKDEQTRGAVLQWLIPTVVLIVVVIVMLFNFSAKSNKAAADEVENVLINTAEEYATKVHHELLRMSDAGKPVGSLMKMHVQSDGNAMIQASRALQDNTEAYAVVYLNGRGVGLMNDGKAISLRDAEYFADIEKAMENVGETEENTAVKFIYVKDDGLGTGREAIISVIILEGNKSGDVLLMYYPVESLKLLFKKSEFDADCFYALVNPEGVIMESEGSQSNFLVDSNIWDAVKSNKEYSSDKLVKTTVRMKNKTPGIFQAVVGGESRTLVYAPVGINNWALIIGINQSYVDNMQNKEWNNTKQMVYQLIIAISIFLGLVLVFSIVNKIKSSEKSKELEEKADTDQLTSLCNKLATERKIKEYMQNYPNEQALMFVLDIDNFKKINDTLGHAFGDEVLRSLGHQIGAVFRATDVIGRTGGDEFTIFLKHLNEDFLLEKEAKKLCNFFKNFQAGEYVKYAATASIGAAVYPRDGKDFESLYKAADNALYTAKKRGKSQLAFYGDDDNKSEGKKKVEEESRESTK